MRPIRRLPRLVVATERTTLTVMVSKPNKTPTWQIATVGGTVPRTVQTGGTLEVVLLVFSIQPFRIVATRTINPTHVPPEVGQIQSVPFLGYKRCSNVDERCSKNL